MRPGEAVAGRVFLVTGGGGFIGSHLTARLLADGARVRVLDNFSTGSQGVAPTGPPGPVC